MALHIRGAEFCHRSHLVSFLATFRPWHVNSPCTVANLCMQQIRTLGLRQPEAMEGRPAARDAADFWPVTDAFQLTSVIKFSAARFQRGPPLSPHLALSFLSSWLGQGARGRMLTVSGPHLPFHPFSQNDRSQDTTSCGATLTHLAAWSGELRKARQVQNPRVPFSA